MKIVSLFYFIDEERSAIYDNLFKLEVPLSTSKDYIMLHKYTNII